MPSKVWEKQLLILVADLTRDIDKDGTAGFRDRFNQSPESVMDDYAVPEEGRVLLYRSAVDLQGQTHRGALAWTMGSVATQLCQDDALQACSPSTATGSRGLIDLIADMLRKSWLIPAYNDSPDSALLMEDVYGDARAALATLDDAERCKEVGRRVTWEVLNFVFGGPPEDEWAHQYPPPCTPDGAEALATAATTSPAATIADVHVEWSDPGACVRDVNVQGTTVAQAPNSGPVTLEVRGEGFRKNATLSLRISSQSALIEGSSVVVSGSYRRSKLTGEVDLTGVLPGCYDVVVSNAGVPLGTDVCFLVVEA